MQKRSLVFSTVTLLGLVTACVTPAQRAAMQRDINYLDQELSTLQNRMNAQSKQTEQNLKTSLSSQSEVQQLQAEIAENAGEIDSLKKELNKIAEIGSESAERYRASLQIHSKEIEELQKKVAYFDTTYHPTEKKVYPAQKIKDSFKPKNAADVNRTLKRDYEKGWFKTVVLKSSMVIQSPESKADMIETAIEFRGEAKYKLSDYSAAIVDFTNYLENYPQGSKRSRALLLLGDSYVFLKKSAVAKSYYTECAKLYGKSFEGKACTARLEKL